MFAPCMARVVAGVGIGVAYAVAGALKGQQVPQLPYVPRMVGGHVKPTTLMLRWTDTRTNSGLPPRHIAGQVLLTTIA